MRASAGLVCWGGGGEGGGGGESFCRFGLLGEGGGGGGQLLQVWFVALQRTFSWD